MAALSDRYRSAKAAPARKADVVKCTCHGEITVHFDTGRTEYTLKMGLPLQEVLLHSGMVANG